jgi:SAM-dependent methyltransferase
MHHTFVGWFLSRLPSDGRVVDAACGTGKYFPMVLASGRRLVGVDHAGALLANAAAKFPQVPPPSMTSRSCPTRASSTACVDAMEFVPPEEWPPVLERFRRALRPRGWLYLTVELAPGDRVRAANQAARRRGLPVVDGEVIWEGPTATTITTRACSESEHGLPMPCHHR